MHKYELRMKKTIEKKKSAFEKKYTKYLMNIQRVGRWKI